MSDLKALLKSDPSLLSNILSHLPDLADSASLFMVDQETYHFATQKETIRMIWSACLPQSPSKIPLSIYTPLYFQPRVHVIDGTPPRSLETFHVYEIRYTDLSEQRALVQFQKIPYSENPTLHLLNLMEAELAISQANLIDRFGTLALTKPTREAIIRKECALWLNFLRDGTTNREEQHIRVNTHFGFSLIALMDVLLNEETLDLEFNEPDSLKQMKQESGYQVIIDSLLSGLISFDQFKSICLPSLKVRQDFNLTEAFDKRPFELYSEMEREVTDKKQPVPYIRLFKKLRDISLLEQSTASACETLEALMIQLVTLKHFSCDIFHQIFLVTNRNKYPTELIINRLTLFIRAVHEGIFDLLRINQAFAKNPHLRLPLVYLNESFYEAVRAGFIPLDLFHEGCSIDDTYDPYFLAPKELDLHLFPNSYMFPVGFFSNLNRVYTGFMTLLTQAPDFQTNRQSMIREATAILYQTTGTKSFTLNSFTDTDLLQKFFKRFCESHQRRQTQIKRLIEKHPTLQDHQDLLLSRRLQDIIMPISSWSNIEKYQTDPGIDLFFRDIEFNFEQMTQQTDFVTDLLKIANERREDLIDAIDQVEQCIKSQTDPQNITPAFTGLIKLHFNGIKVEAILSILSPLVDLFEKASFPTSVSVWSFMEQSLRKSSPILENLENSFLPHRLVPMTQERWFTQIQFIKHQTLKVAATYFGAEGGYQIFSSLFSCPIRLFNTLFLLAFGTWKEKDFTDFITAYTKMHYSFDAREYFQYMPEPDLIDNEVEATEATREREVAARKAFEEGNRCLPDLYASGFIEANLFADTLLNSTLYQSVNPSPLTYKPAKTLWNDACQAAFEEIELEDDEDDNEDDNE